MAAMIPFGKTETFHFECTELGASSSSGCPTSLLLVLSRRVKSTTPPTIRPMALLKELQVLVKSAAVKLHPFSTNSILARPGDYMLLEDPKDVIGQMTGTNGD